MAQRGWKVRAGLLPAAWAIGLVAATTAVTVPAQAVSSSSGAVSPPSAQAQAQARTESGVRPTRHRSDVVRVKLRPGLGLTADGTRFTGSGAGRLNSVLSVGAPSLRREATPPIRRLFAGSEERPTRIAAAADLPDLSGYFRIRVPRGTTSTAIATALAKIPGVLTAYPEPLPAPLPATPSLSSDQGYRTPAPVGTTGTLMARTWPGATGSGAKIYDLEYSWSGAHEDLAAARAPGARITIGNAEDPFGDNNHGTAVLGVLSGDNNGYGVTGLVPGSPIRLVNTYSSDLGWNVAGAVYSAANNASAGDVVLIEQQVYGPDDVLLPVEWQPDVYDAIRYAVGLGIHVVEAGANGGADLDDPAYGSRFPAGEADSGAILVGAGSACPGGGARQRLEFSNYGSRVNLQGWGECVTTTGYGDLFDGGWTSRYTSSFNGTSSASPIVAASVAAYSSAYQRLNGVPPTPAKVRADLVATGTPQVDPAAGHIGPLPDLERALKRTDTESPTEPGDLRVAVNAAGHPVLVWEPATDNSGVARYNVYRGAVLVATIGPRYVWMDEKLAPGTYQYRVQAVDRADRVSGFSNTRVLVVGVEPGRKP